VRAVPRADCAIRACGSKTAGGARTVSSGVNLKSGPVTSFSVWIRPIRWLLDRTVLVNFVVAGPDIDGDEFAVIIRGLERGPHLLIEDLPSEEGEFVWGMA
jgi:hypothetical protein